MSSNNLYSRKAVIDIDKFNNQLNSNGLGNLKVEYEDLLTVKKDGTEDVVFSVVNKEKDKFLKNKNKLEKHNLELGGFIFMIYLKNEILFKDINVEKTNISRLIYLSTYMDYKEKGLLVYKESSKNIPMTKLKMREVLGLTESTFKRFFSNVKKQNLIKEIDKRFYINTDYFMKGEIEDRKELKNNNLGYCRLYIDTIRFLYEGCKTSQHKVLSNVFQLIPFTHSEENIISHTIEKGEVVSPMTLNEICDLLNIGEDPAVRTRFAKSMYEFFIIKDEVKYRVFSYIIANGGAVDYFMLNPLVSYHGNKLDIINNSLNKLIFNTEIKRQIRKSK